MAFFAIIMLDMALELAEHDPVYEDMASKFFEHFLAIVDAINSVGNEGRPVSFICTNKQSTFTSFEIKCRFRCSLYVYLYN